MKRIAVVVLSLLTLALACSSSNADFRCRGRHISAPCFTPTVCHEVVHHEVAAVVAPTTTIIVQEPLPVFFFQNFQGNPYMPASVTTPPTQPPAFQAQAQAPQRQEGLVLSDQQMDRLANIIIAKMGGGAAVTQNTLIAPPLLAEDEKISMSQQVVNDIGAKCAKCHMTGTATKGGLAIFDADRNFNPTKGGVAYATPERLWQRAHEGTMPPAATTDPGQRLNPESIAFLRQAIGQ